jgi:hypothetical protein
MLPTSHPPLRRLIDAKAHFAGLPVWRSLRYKMQWLPGEWVEAMIMTESSGNARARRYEPHQDRATRRDAPTDPDTCDVDDGLIEDDASYGLMQVMGYNLRAAVGCMLVKTILTPAGPRLISDAAGAFAPMSFAWAFDPDRNITEGIKIVASELSFVGGDVERALARYNGGPSGDDVTPEYGNDMRLRRYVDKVASWAAKVAQDRTARGWPLISA